MTTSPIFDPRRITEHGFALEYALEAFERREYQEAYAFIRAISENLPKCHNTAVDKSPATFHLKTGSDLREMDIRVEWVVENLVPKKAVILLYGRGGIGKTTLVMMLAHAIDQAHAIFGMATVKAPVIVVDYENSLAVLSERAKRTGVQGVLFWDSSLAPPPLDKPDWKIYMDLLTLYPGAVLVFDTLRSSHSGDENSSETMALIMSRFRKLRDAGATIILLHHTPKRSDRNLRAAAQSLTYATRLLRFTRS